MKKVEYSTGKVKCKSCNNKVEKDQITVGQEVTKGQTKSTSWFHLDCYQVPLDLKDASTFQGLNNLKPDDKEKVSNYFGKEENHFKPSKVSLSESQNLSEDEKKIVSMAKILSKKFSLEKLKKMLETNQQTVEEGKKMELSEVIAEGILHGALPKCPKCQKHVLKLNQDVFYCPTLKNEPSCGYKYGRDYKEGSAPVRIPWKFLENEKELIEKPKRENEDEGKSEKKQKIENPVPPPQIQVTGPASK